MISPVIGQMTRDTLSGGGSRSAGPCVCGSYEYSTVLFFVFFPPLIWPLRDEGQTVTLDRLSPKKKMKAKDLIQGHFLAHLGSLSLKASA